MSLEGSNLHNDTHVMLRTVLQQDVRFIGRLAVLAARRNGEGRKWKEEEVVQKD